jgi:hypothetical protein
MWVSSVTMRRCVVAFGALVGLLAARQEAFGQG